MSAELADALAKVLGAGAIDGLRRLSGGASRATWAFEADGRALILRMDPPGATSGGLAREADLLRGAAATGVPVPEVIANGDGSDGIGAPYIVMNHVDGETIARKILRDDVYASARPLMARQCGEILANIHRMPIDSADGLPDDDALEKYAGIYKMFGQPHPTFDLAIKWLRETRPATSRRTIVHGDFRNGNLIVGPEGVRSVLDWELTHIGDPIEDLGWLCANAWRFGGEHLRHIGLGAGIVACLISGDAVVDEQFGGAHLRIGAADGELDALILADRTAEQHALLRVA